VRERHDDEIARFDGADVCPNRFDDADGLVPHDTACVAWLHRLERPEVASADAGTRDGDEGVGWFDYAGVRDVLYSDVASAIHDSCSHALSYLSFMSVGGCGSYTAQPGQSGCRVVQFARHFDHRPAEPHAREEPLRRLVPLSGRKHHAWH